MAESAGFRCLFGTERVSDEVVEALGLLAEQTHVYEKMEKMQSGEVVNFIEGFESENRPALHTALRDFFEGPQTAKTALQAKEMALAWPRRINCRFLRRGWSPIANRLDFTLARTQALSAIAQKANGTDPRRSSLISPL